MEIVTGSTGAVHVTPIDDAVRNTNLVLNGEKAVFTYFENLSARAITANEVRVFSGYGINQGRIFKIDRNEYDSVTIENGASGYKRSDLIVARYTMNQQTGFEDISLEVIKGASGSSYTDPTYTTGNINEGAILDDFPLYRVKINGLQIEAVERLFTLYPLGGKIGQILQRLDGQMLTNLASESKGKLDGSANVDIGVKGILPIAHGGTGANTNAGAAKNVVINAASSDTSAMTDATEFITSESNSGFVNSIKKRTALNIWNYILTKIKSMFGMGSSEIVSVTHGGTGKSSVTAGSVLVGNGTDAMTEKSIVNILDTSDNLPTAKAVSDAMGEAGYGDMLKSVYTNTQNDTIAVSKGGTGSTDGTLNGVKLATSGATKGFINSNGDFQAFRNPTGGVASSNQATAAQVLSGKHFANSSSDDLTGTFASQEKTVTAGTAATSVSPDSGKWLSKVTVNPTPSEAKTATPSTSAQTISPSSGKLLSKVTVNAVSLSGNAAAANVLSGKTFYNTSLTKQTGTMANRAAQTEPYSYGDDGTYMYARIPQGAYVTNASGLNYPEIKMKKSDTPAYTTGYSAGNTAGYNNGISQGHADKRGEFGIYCKITDLSSSVVFVDVYMARRATPTEKVVQIFGFQWTVGNSGHWELKGINAEFGYDIAMTVFN